MKRSSVRTQRHRVVFGVGLLTAGVALAGCGAGSVETASTHDSGGVTVTNCRTEKTFPQPAEKIYVNESQMLSNLFALGADDQNAAVSGLPHGKQEMMKDIYGERRIDSLPINSGEYATLENVMAEQPDTMTTDINRGYSVEDNLTPATLDKHGIPAYVSTPTCRQDTGDAEGIMPPWKAIKTDIRNVGRITGKQDQARSTITDIQQRLDR